MRKNKPKSEPQNCKQCGKRFQPSRKNQIYCSPQCKNDAHCDFLYAAIEHYRKCPLAKKEKTEKGE